MLFIEARWVNNGWLIVKGLNIIDPKFHSVEQKKFDSSIALAQEPTT